MKPLCKTALLTLAALVLLAGSAAAQCLNSNGDFENGSTGWTTNQGSFLVGANPNDANDDEGNLRGASGYTTQIQQTFSFSTSGWHAVLLFMEGDNSAEDACEVTATIVAGSLNQSATDDVVWDALTFTFQVASGVTSGTVKVAVTCPDSGLGRYIAVDDVCVFEI